MTVWKRCFWMARYPRMVDGDNVRLLRLIYSSMETVSVGSCSGSSGFSGSRFLANHSALMAAASLVQSLAVAAVTGMLSPPRRSWINQFPDGSFRGFGVFKCIPPHHKTFVWFLFNRKAACWGGSYCVFSTDVLWLYPALPVTVGGWPSDRGQLLAL